MNNPDAYEKGLAALPGIRERCDKATPGPWKHHCFDGDRIVSSAEPPQVVLRDPDIERFHWKQGERVERDWDFIAASRTDLPLLCDALEAAQAEIERLGKTAFLTNETLLAVSKVEPAPKPEPQGRKQWIVEKASAIEAADGYVAIWNEADGVFDRKGVVVVREVTPDALPDAEELGKFILDWTRTRVLGQNNAEPWQEPLGRAVIDRFPSLALPVVTREQFERLALMWCRQQLTTDEFAYQLGILVEE